MTVLRPTSLVRLSQRVQRWRHRHAHTLDAVALALILLGLLVVWGLALRFLPP